VAVIPVVENNQLDYNPAVIANPNWPVWLGALEDGS
jgi:hypothetical protein